MDFRRENSRSVPQKSSIQKYYSVKYVVFFSLSFKLFGSSFCPRAYYQIFLKEHIHTQIKHCFPVFGHMGILKPAWELIHSIPDGFTINFEFPF